MVKIKKEGVLLVISSPSGTGKTTICKKLLEYDKNLHLSVSVTTRKKRKNEVEGIDYYFKTKKDFLNLKSENFFIENAFVFENYYGTLKSEVLKRLENGIDVLIDIDWQGTRQIRNKDLNYKLITIYILPPSKKELLNRLIKRERKNIKTVNKRMKEFKKELSKWKEYDYVVVNDDLKVCYKKIMSVIKSKNKLSYNYNLINNHVEKLLS